MSGLNIHRIIIFHAENKKKEILNVTQQFIFNPLISRPRTGISEKGLILVIFYLHQLNNLYFYITLVIIL